MPATESPAFQIADRARISELFLGGLDGAEKALLPEESQWLSDRAMEGQDRRNLLAGYANLAWLAEHTGRPPSEIEGRYMEYSAGLREHFKLDPTASDADLYGHIQQWETETKTREDRTISAMAAGALAAASGKNALHGFQEWKLKAGQPQWENPDDNADFLAFDQARRELQAKWGEDNLAKIRGLLIAAKGEEGRGMEVPENKRDDLLGWFADLDAPKQDAVFSIVAAMAADASPEESKGIDAFLKSLSRSVFKMDVANTTAALSRYTAPGPWLVHKTYPDAANIPLVFERGYRGKAPTAEHPSDVLAQPKKAGSPDFVPDEGSQYRLATPEEAARLDKQFQRLESMQRAKMRFEQMRASAAPFIPKDKRSWLQNTGIMLGDNIPVIGVGMMTGAVPLVGVMAVRETIQGQRYHEYRDQGIDVNQSMKMATITASMEAPVEILSNYVLLGRFKKLRKALSIDPTKGKLHVAGAFAAQFLKGAATEFTEEQIQDYMPKVTQELSRWLGDDVPEVDWQKVNDDLWNWERVRDLSGVIVPMALLGAGVATVTEYNATDNARGGQKQALLDMGMTQESIDEFMAISDPTERAIAVGKEIVRANAASSPQAQEAFDMAENQFDFASPAMEDASTPVLPVLTRDEKGYILRFPDDTFERVPDLLTAKTMIRTWADESLQADENAAYDEAMALQEGSLEGLAKHYEANPGQFGPLTVKLTDEEGPVREPDPDSTEEELRAIRQDIASAAVMAGGEQAIPGATAYRIFGETEIEFKEGIADAVITMFKGGTVLDLFEEKGHAWWEAAYRAKWFTREEAIAQLRKVEETTGDEYLADLDGLDDAGIDQTVMEGLAGWSMTWASGKVRNSKAIPNSKGIRAAMAAMVKYIRHILSRAARLYKMQRDGKLDTRWEEYLNKSVGLDGERVEQVAANATTAGVAQAILSPEEIKAAEIAGRLDALGLTEEQAVEIVDNIMAQAPVETSTADVPRKLKVREMVDWLLGQGAQGEAEHPGIGKITVNRRSFKDMISHQMRAKKAAAALVMKSLLPGATLFHVNTSRARPSYRLAAKVRIDGRDFVARIVVDEVVDKGVTLRVYNHELSDIQELEQGTKNHQETRTGADSENQPYATFPDDTARVLEFLFSVKKNRVSRKATRPVGPDGRLVQVWTRNQVERLTRSLAAKFQGNPVERAEAASRAINRIQALIHDARERHARLSGKNASPADHDLEWIKAGMREFDTIIKILPAEARGMLDGTGLRNQVIEAKTSYGRANALLKLADRVAAAMEQHLRLAERERIGDVLARSSPERTETRRVKGRIGAEAHDMMAQAENAMAMTPDDVRKDIEGINKQITEGINGEPLTPAEVADKLDRINILEIFGGIDDPETTAAALSLARETLEEIHEHGKMTAAVLREERDAKVAKLVQTLAGAVGNISSQYADKNQADTERLKEGIFQKIERVLLNDFTAIPDLVAELKRHTSDPAVLDGLQEIENTLRHATNRASDNRIKTDGEWNDFLKELFGDRWFNGSASKLGKMATRKSRAGEITVRPAFRVEQTPIPLDRVPGILNGSLSLGYSRADKDAIEDAWHAHLAEEASARRQGKPSRKRKLQWSKWVSSPAKDIFLTEQEAINHSLLWRQDDLRPNMRRMGFDETTMDQIEEFLSPEAKAIREWLGRRGEVEFPEIDRVHRAVNGVGLPKVKDHFRASFEHAGQQPAGLDPFNGGMGATSGQGSGRAGFSRHRVRHNADLRDVSALAVWQAHMEEVNHWKAWAEPLDLLGAAFRDRKVRDTLRTAFGKTLADTIEQRFLMLGNSGIYRAGIRLEWDRVLGNWRGAAVTATLGLRIQTRLVQASAALASLSSRDMTVASYLRGIIALATHPTRYRRILKSPTVQRRVKLGNNWATQIAKMGKDSDPSALSRMARVFVSDLPHVDAWFTTISAAAAYDAGLQAAAKRGLDGHAAEEWAADFMDRVVMETAQPNTDYARSALEIQKSGDSVQWMLWPYASEPRLRATKDALALRDMLSPATTGDRSRALRVLMANRLMALTTAAVIYSWSQATRKEEDEDRAHDDWRWWALMSITGHFGGVPVVGDMAEHVAAMVTGQRAPVSGIPIARDVMAAIQSISKALKDGENMDGDQWFKLATSLAKGAGVLDQRLALFAQIANLATSVKGLASNLAESPEEAGEQRELQKLAREQREWQDNRKLDLDKAEKELRALPEAERWKALAERHADDPETMRELLSRLRAPALEPDEARLRKFAVDGGFRARAIAAVVKQRKLDQAATAELLGRLRAKRVLVPAMEADLKKALEADGN